MTSGPGPEKAITSASGENNEFWGPHAITNRRQAGRRALHNRWPRLLSPEMETALAPAMGEAAGDGRLTLPAVSASCHSASV